ncbi:ATP-binding protein [Amycolatopsis pithecellobii]|uniref:ATP-binding protein n=1 Tax=Amycolatopsis pithecellobii TaxID=664692 RepID=A0A6N7Z553_9PSEU|nr:ATP-binding protein [Amycolatopsis pithecellobii]MTD57343.1 ATP-binding protein [Amycolatopsis pithecellobii]
MRNHAEITLVRTPEAPRRARRFVDGICEGWHVPTLTGEAELVASELVENTLQHTESTPRLSLELRRGELTIAVSDDNPRRAYVRDDGGRGGYGMKMIADAARTWGCTPSSSGGKTVWARLAA